MSATPSTCIELRIPPLRDAETRRAYAAALIQDIALTAEELEAKPTVLRLIGTEYLNPDSLLDVSIALHRYLIGENTGVYAEVLPRGMSAALVSCLRNLCVGWYTLDFHTLNISDLKASGGRQDLSYYENLKRLIQTYRLTNFTAVLHVGIPSQNASSLQDSLQRAADLGAGAITLRPETAPAEGVDTEELLCKGKTFAESLGYECVLDGEEIRLALPSFREEYLLACCPAEEQLGIGCDAVTRLEGMSFRNTDDPQLYIAHVGEPDILMRSMEAES